MSSRPRRSLRKRHTFTEKCQIRFRFLDGHIQHRHKFHIEFLFRQKYHTRLHLPANQSPLVKLGSKRKWGFYQAITRLLLLVPTQIDEFHHGFKKVLKVPFDSIQVESLEMLRQGSRNPERRHDKFHTVNIQFHRFKLSPAKRNPGQDVGRTEIRRIRPGGSDPLGKQLPLPGMSHGQAKTGHILAAAYRVYRVHGRQCRRIPPASGGHQKIIIRYESAPPSRGKEIVKPETILVTIIRYMQIGKSFIDPTGI